jgi:branched-chain amino acid transport system permease protein
VEFLVISLLNGISYGLLLFLLSSGLTLIFSMMGVLNFAHASFYMLGAYFAYAIASKIGFWPALVLAPLLVVVVGALVERFGLRTVHKYGHVAELLFTFGLAYLIEEAVKLVWGQSAVPYRIPQELDGPLFQVFTSVFPKYRAFMMLVSVLMLVTMYLVLTRTRIGLVIQAALTHPHMVEALGHNVQRVFMLVFAGGAALAGLAGVIGGNAFVTSPSMAASVGTIVFVVAVVGGMGSLADRAGADVCRHHRRFARRPLRLYRLACNERHAAFLDMEADRVADGAGSALSSDGGHDDCASARSHGNPGGLDHETYPEA